MFKRPSIIGAMLLAMLLFLQPAHSAEQRVLPEIIERQEVSAEDWALRAAASLGVTGEPNEVYVAQLPFEDVQRLLTEEEIVSTAHDTGRTIEEVRAIWAERNMKALYALEKEWLDTWTIVELRGGIRYRPRMGGENKKDREVYDNLRLYFVQGSLVGETGFLGTTGLAPWGHLVITKETGAPERLISAPVLAFPAATETPRQPAAVEQLCAQPCVNGGDVCNAVLRLSNPSLEVSGARARLRVGDPSLCTLDEFHAWSANRVAVGRYENSVYFEVGWIKWLCFTSVGCPYYGSWKHLHRHIVVRRNVHGRYDLWDMANTQVGRNHIYRVENEWIGAPWNVWAWAAYVENHKFLHSWTGFELGEDPWYGAETKNIPVLNEMDASVSETQYRHASNGQWYDVGNQYKLSVHFPYSISAGYGSAAMSGCDCFE